MEDNVSDGLEDRVCNQIEFLNTEFKDTMYNLLAYIKHLEGQNEAALECLQQAEELIQQEHAHQVEIRSLVTWGNYAWIYYHMGRFSEAQHYVDKVQQVCEKFSNPYSIECPELDSEEGWTWLKCGGNRHERAKVCFEMALEERPNDPEFSSGLAIAMHQLDKTPQQQFPVDLLKQAIELNPNNQYIKVLLALKLQKMKGEGEKESLVEEALQKAHHQTDVLQSAAKFYKRKGELDKAIELYLRAVESMPNNNYLYCQIGSCYMQKVKQMETTEEKVANKTREIEELKQCAADYFKKALEKKTECPFAYANLAELLAPKGLYRQAKECHQVAFSQEAERQQPHQWSGCSQEYHVTSEVPALQPYLEDIQRSKTSAEQEMMRDKLQSTAENHLSLKAPNSWYHQGLSHKANGDISQAVECYEKELGRRLQNTPSGLGNLFLPAPEAGEDSEEMGQRTHGPTPKEPPNP
ncbi:PREDICTED: interferon-induced protein with tetratricopeptide repeats 3 [Elephantulus edwardii]|uniref:interferon-induced protein with tetratricopeptide repeats 3 n=1 Tax=Elephantulus edwardii TaxID=28737 RepID=UPI0003F066A2|nr:PREDICTED: interferon-induced protein with tetratricopeptide repeats 3 [Elephantulus edwardii]